MSADRCLVFYGIRIEIQENEIEGLEKRTDPRVRAARKAGLNHYWGNFGGAADRFLLLIGAQLAVMGPENMLDRTVSSSELRALLENTMDKLRAAELVGEPALHIEWEPDV